MLLIQTRQSQLKVKHEHLESRARMKNLRIFYSVPKNCERNIMIEVVKRLIREKLEIGSELNKLGIQADDQYIDIKADVYFTVEFSGESF